MAGADGFPTAGHESAEMAYDRFAPIYNRWNSSNDYEGWLGNYLLPLLECHHLRHGAVLDVGCGTGRAFDPLLRRGWRVVGCDVSKGMLSVARREHGERVPLLRADARDLPADLAARCLGNSAGFDLILMLNDVVNYLLAEPELDAALIGVRRNLRAEGGLLLFDANTLSLFEADYSSEVKEQRGESTWQGLAEKLTPGGVFQGFIAGKGVESNLHTQRHWTQAQVESALGRAGLSLQDYVGQHEVQGRLSLSTCPDEVRDEKVIYVARHR